MNAWLKKEFDLLGYKTECPIDGLLLVKNFLSTEDINEILEFIKNTPDEQWDQWYIDQQKVFTKQKFGREDYENLVKEGLYEVTQNWNDKNLQYIDSKMHRNADKKFQEALDMTGENLILSGFYFIQRMYADTELVAHHDQNTDESIAHAAVIYLNDDYVGGEIFWTYKNFQMKPEPGDMLVFGGNEEWHHGVKFVKEGPTRYVLPSFIKIPDFYKN